MAKMKKNYSVGMPLLGTPESRRHQYHYYGKLVGYRCKRCSLPKPRADLDEVECGGSPIMTTYQRQSAKELSLPNYLMAIAWKVQKNQAGAEMDPNVWLANRAAFMAPILQFGHVNYEFMAREVAQDAQSVYKAGTNGDPLTATYGACLFASKLCTDGLLDPLNQAVMTGLVILEEARESPAEYGYKQTDSENVARRMLKEARTLGYYGNPSNLIAT